MLSGMHTLAGIVRRQTSLHVRRDTCVVSRAITETSKYIDEALRGCHDALESNACAGGYFKSRGVRRSFVGGRGKASTVGCASVNASSVAVLLRSPGGELRRTPSFARRHARALDGKLSARWLRDFAVGLPSEARAKRERRMVRKERFELSRSCERQPLKLVRLPVPPLSRGG